MPMAGHMTLNHWPGTQNNISETLSPRITLHAIRFETLSQIACMISFLIFLKLEPDYM